MQAIRFHPETERCFVADPVIESASSTGSIPRADIALLSAILAPLVIVGLLVLIGVAVADAVCIMFFSIFAVTTTLDVRWIRRGRRANLDPRRTPA